MKTKKKSPKPSRSMGGWVEDAVMTLVQARLLDRIAHWQASYQKKV